MSAKKNYSFRLRMDTMNDVQEIAKTENRTSTNLVETLLIDFIKKWKRKKQTA